ncbi:hypothetical protein Acr_10g0006330 [Actinidia rufa]|uniref:Uncharacterized protein n=1 Tax=Actinidia rufa TaxID=165716 RepID=A0A7J0F966_9ERIC|nr:hypothetical protein Acr_10g0006330 [Actinidia rufa]
MCDSSGGYATPVVVVIQFVILDTPVVFLRLLGYAIPGLAAACTARRGCGNGDLVDGAVMVVLLLLEGCGGDDVGVMVLRGSRVGHRGGGRGGRQLIDSDWWWRFVDNILSLT